MADNKNKDGFIVDYIRYSASSIASGKEKLEGIGTRADRRPFDKGTLVCHHTDLGEAFTMRQLLGDPRTMSKRGEIETALISLHNQIYPVNKLDRMVGTVVPQVTPESAQITEPLKALCKIAYDSFNGSTIPTPGNIPDKAATGPVLEK